MMISTSVLLWLSCKKFCFCLNYCEQSESIVVSDRFYSSVVRGENLIQEHNLFNKEETKTITKDKVMEKNTGATRAEGKTRVTETLV